MPIAPRPMNETVRNYAPGSAERDSLKRRLEQMAGEVIDIPVIIGGKEIRTGKTKNVVMPHDHGHVLAQVHIAGPKEIEMARDAALKAKSQWESLLPSDRMGVFLKAAELLAGPYRDTLNAATMLGQSKNAYQAEIDSACELIDFLRFNVHFYEEILAEQPVSSAGVWNQTDWRPLEGFILAITPFNFTAIAGNLPSAPALLGNTIVWKPAETQSLAAYYIMKLFQEAGLPPGVLNLVPSSGAEIGGILMKDPNFSGLHFTGSTQTFQTLWLAAAQNLSNYKTYPRLVGETGGKDFIFAHESADPDALVAAIVRGGFEYQGQKCSAASRVYVPKNLWNRMKPKLISEVQSLKIGDVRDFSNFVNAVIDQKSFQSIAEYLKFAKNNGDAKICVGGGAQNSKGYFVEPTLIETTQPQFKTMVEEIFGPVVTIFGYDENKFEETLGLCDQSSPYALTGAIFAQDRNLIAHMSKSLRHSAGNFYINDKPTGAVVGQQPFGGARASGTNDKAGSALNLLRWLSPRTVKETFAPARDYRYPFHQSS